jgi:hypothetical protein
LIAVKVYGLLSSCRHYQSDCSDSYSDFAPRWLFAENDEKVSPTRNNNAHSRYSPHNRDIGGYAAFIRVRRNSTHFRQYFSHSHNSCSPSRNHGNYRSSSRRLDSYLVALARITAVLYPEKEANVPHPNLMAYRATPGNPTVLTFLHNYFALAGK